MTNTEIKDLIRQELPQALAQDPAIRDFILRTVSDYYAGKTETDSKFDRVMARLEQESQEQKRKWDEQRVLNQQTLAEIRQLRDEQNQKWDEQRVLNQQILGEIQKIHRKHDSAIGALGARWGLNSEASFRNALKGILTDSFGVEVLNINDFDAEGEVFGRPDQVEIDVIIRNGIVIVCEIKSSIDKGAMYLFDRKVAFYEKHYQTIADRKLVVSPMVAPNAFPVAKRLGIEVYSYAEDVPEDAPE